MASPAASSNWTAPFLPLLHKLEALFPSSSTAASTTSLLILYDTLVPLLSDLTPTTLTTLTTLLATALAVLFLLARRFLMQRSSFSQVYQNGGLGTGARSPYGAYSRDPAGRSVSDLYDYVDEQHNVLSSPAHMPAPPVFEDDDAPDVIHLRFRGDSFKFEFPPFSIAEEKVQVHHVRDRVAQRLGLDGQEGRIKLLYKDRDLRRNDEPLRKYGCKQNSEITVILTQEVRDYSGRRGRSGSESDSYASSTRRSHEEDRRTERAYSTVRPRETERKFSTREEDPRANYVSSNGYLQPHSTPPSATTPPRQHSPIRPQDPARRSSPTVTSAPRPAPPPEPKPTADPSTPLGKIQTISYEFHTQWLPLIQKFVRVPPADQDDRDKEFRRLNDILDKKVFGVGDMVEAEGSDRDEIKRTRKQLYEEVHAISKELEKYKPRG